MVPRQESSCTFFGTKGPGGLGVETSASIAASTLFGRIDVVTRSFDRRMIERLLYDPGRSRCGVTRAGEAFQVVQLDVFARRDVGRVLNRVPLAIPSLLRAIERKNELRSFSNRQYVPHCSRMQRFHPFHVAFVDRCRHANSASRQIHVTPPQSKERFVAKPPSSQPRKSEPAAKPSPNRLRFRT